MIKVFDIVSTDRGAFRLLRTRVTKLNIGMEFENIIVCPPGKWSEKLKSEGIDVINIKMDRELNLTGLLREIRMFKTLMLKNKPHIIHCHNSKAGAVARIAAYIINRKAKEKIRVIHQVHGYHFTQFKGIKRMIFKKIEVYLSKKTDMLLFQNLYEFELSKIIGIDKNCRLKYIGNGINIKELEKSKKWKVRNDTAKIIVCVARLEPVKNHKMLIEGLGVLKRKYKYEDFKAVFIGEGDTNQFDKDIEKYHLSNNVVFKGELDREELIENTMNCDISVLTSLKEGKPRALMEALVMGKPCIGTDVVGTNEIIVDNVNGYLVKLGETERLADCIYKLLTDENTYKKFSENASSYGRDNFNEDMIIEEIKRIYREVIQLKGEEKLS